MQFSLKPPVYISIGFSFWTKDYGRKDRPTTWQAFMCFVLTKGDTNISMPLEMYIFKVGQFAHNATLNRDGGLVERSGWQRAQLGPSIGTGCGSSRPIAARARSAIGLNNQA